MIGDECPGLALFAGLFLEGTFFFHIGTVERTNRDSERVGLVF